MRGDYGGQEVHGQAFGNGKARRNVFRAVHCSAPSVKAGEPCEGSREEQRREGVKFPAWRPAAINGETGQMCGFERKRARERERGMKNKQKEKQQEKTKGKKRDAKRRERGER
ncbi:splicing factor U2AF family SnRNP auxilary factor large subunit, RRM domain-containing protein [Toxoplasma gondii FOU]|uniref:Splicing factor U2AF family SnRNP auxilary factor large subunit, RRM domain-containing protein n=1 Tax=Toxoplasma gondii FOU TaxID=943167 RepID=A0A086KGY1_TOXGO|nr:splicing factor U2AF family SnRNP auxilary factor large subunit, RRM domain-containing protein [Toxoplasma gondii FOU]